LESLSSNLVQIGFLELFANWFYDHFMREVDKHQTYELKHENTKTLLLLDTTATRPSTGMLRSKDLKNFKLLGFSPPTNYTDRATAACRRS
jgi:hypothetical protein